jgi:hypothetical protein
MNDDLISQKTANAASVCVDGKVFYLLSTSYWYRSGLEICGTCDCISIDGTNCPSVCDEAICRFQPLPGAGQIDGKTWGSLTVQDIVIGSYNSYKANGNKNGYQLPSSTADLLKGAGDGELIFQHGVQSAGFFGLPVCDFDTVVKKTGSKFDDGVAANPKYFPCN